MGHSITVLTDHRALLDRFNKSDLSPKHTRQYLTISDFNAKFKLISGNTNIIVDTLPCNNAHSSNANELVNSLSLIPESLDWGKDIIISEQDKDARWSKAL